MSILFKFTTPIAYLRVIENQLPGITLWLHDFRHNYDVYLEVIEASWKRKYSMDVFDVNAAGDDGKRGATSVKNLLNDLDDVNDTIWIRCDLVVTVKE